MYNLKLPAAFFLLSTAAGHGFDKVGVVIGVGCVVTGLEGGVEKTLGGVVVDEVGHYQTWH